MRFEKTKTLSDTRQGCKPLTLGPKSIALSHFGGYKVTGCFFEDLKWIRFC